MELRGKIILEPCRYCGKLCEPSACSAIPGTASWQKITPNRKVGAQMSRGAVSRRKAAAVIWVEPRPPVEQNKVLLLRGTQMWNYVGNKVKQFAMCAGHGLRTKCMLNCGRLGSSLITPRARGISSRLGPEASN